LSKSTLFMNYVLTKIGVVSSASSLTKAFVVFLLETAMLIVVNKATILHATGKKVIIFL